MLKGKKGLIIGLILVLICFSLFQFYQRKQNDEEFDLQFGLGMVDIITGMMEMEEDSGSRDKALSTFSNGIGRAFSLYIYTSYYEENPELLSVLATLDGHATDGTIEGLVSSGTVEKMLPHLKVLFKNPLDKAATEELIAILE